MEFRVEGAGLVRIEFIPDDPPEPVPVPPLSKLMYGFYQDGNNVTEGRQIESRLGKKFGCYRYFASSWGIPSSNALNAAKDRVLLWSVKHSDWRATTLTVTWLPVMKAWKANGNKVIVIFYHEPHDNLDGVTRTPQLFKDSYIAMEAARAEVGANNVILGYCASDPHSSKVDDNMLPPNAEVWCHDGYNKIHGEPDKTFAARWAPVLAKCEKFQKPLVIGEFGCLPGPLPIEGQESRDAWFRAAATYIKTDPLAKKWLRGFCYFHAEHSHNWLFVNPDGTPIGDGLLGWKEAFVNDPYFAGFPIDPRG